MTNSPEPSNNPWRSILGWLDRIWSNQETMHEQTRQNGDGIRQLQVLVDLFRNPDKSVSELAEMFETTLDEMKKSASLTVEVAERTNETLADLLKHDEDRQFRMPEILEQIEASRSEVRMMREEIAALREENRTLSYHLGLDPTPTPTQDDD